jgi:tetratricopeptide (TPR) repeat protein
MNADAAALFTRGQESLANGDAREAIDCFSRVLELHSTFAAAYHRRACCHALLHDRAKALADYDAAIRHQPSDAQLHAERATLRLQQRQYAGAIADCNLVLKLDAGRVDVLVIRSRAHAADGDTAAAFADLNLACQADPDHLAEYLVQRAVIRRNLGGPRGAVDDCDLALQKDPAYALAYEVRAQLRSELGDHADALADYEALSRLEPESLIAARGRLVMLLLVNKPMMALEAATAILRTHPDDVSTIESRARAAVMLDDLVAALLDCDRLVELLGARSASVYLFRGQVRFQHGDAAGAIADYLVGLQKDERNAELWNALAWAWATVEPLRPREAIDAATRAVELAHASGTQVAAYHDTLAAAFAANGDFPSAITHAKTALTLDPSPEYEQRLHQYQARLSG